MPKKISSRHRAAVLEALDATRDAQAEFWDSLGRLEELVGRELDGVVDFHQIDLENLLNLESHL